MQLTQAPAPLHRYFILSAYWFGSSFQWFLLLPILMPKDVSRLVGEADKGTYLSVLLGIPALIPLILPPFLGVWSDRVGRRLPFLGWGVLVTVLGLALMFVAPSYALYFVGYVVVQLGNAIAASPYAALIPDVVPAQDMGRASGAMGFLQLSSQIAGGVALLLLSSRAAQYGVLALVLALATLITLLGVKDPQIKKAGSETAPLRTYLGPEYRDFRWVFLTRAFTESGRWAVQPYLQYYQRDLIGVFALGSLVLKDAGQAVSILLLVLSLTAAITSLAGGSLSDRYGKKRVIFVAGAVMAISALGFALTRSYGVALGMGLLFGLGYGAFISVDWALGASVLPRKEFHARDMGIWHVSMVLPQVAFVPLFGVLLDWANRSSGQSFLGYPVLFGIAIVFFVLGTVFVGRVRRVS